MHLSNVQCDKNASKNITLAQLSSQKQLLEGQIKEFTLQLKGNVVMQKRELASSRDNVLGSLDITSYFISMAKSNASTLIHSPSILWIPK